MEGAAMTHHEVRFYRNPDDGHYRAVCSCGWIENDPVLADLQARAGSHDLNPTEESTDED